MSQEMTQEQLIELIKSRGGEVTPVIGHGTFTCATRTSVAAVKLRNVEGEDINDILQHLRLFPDLGTITLENVHLADIKDYGYFRGFTDLIIYFKGVELSEVDIKEVERQLPECEIRWSD